MTLKRRVKRIFRSAKQELKHAQPTHSSPQELSSAYKLAYVDQDFLVRRELRSVRLQLELLKPELVQNEAKILSTVVIFGSARIFESAIAQKKLKKISAQYEKNPKNKILKTELKIAKKMVEKSYYYDQARTLSQLISQYGKDEKGNALVVVTGGGPGIMEAANRGAHDIGAKSIGLNIVLPQEQGPNLYITPELCFQFHYFAIRKMHFLIRAKALVVFPGGFGTLDELFEALTLIQTEKIEKMPIILVGKHYWQKLINFDFLVEERMISPEDLTLFSYVDNAEQAWQKIQAFYHPNVLLKEALSVKNKPSKFKTAGEISIYYIP